MAEAKVWPWEMDGVRLKAVVQAVSNSRLLWQPMMLVPTLQDTNPTSSAEAVRMVAMGEHPRGTLIAIGDNKGLLSHSCKSSSLQWVALGRTKTQLPMSSSLDIESEAQ